MKRKKKRTGQKKLKKDWLEAHGKVKKKKRKEPIKDKCLQIKGIEWNFEKKRKRPMEKTSLYMAGVHICQNAHILMLNALDNMWQAAHGSETIGTFPNNVLMHHVQINADRIISLDCMLFIQPDSQRLAAYERKYCPDGIQSPWAM